MMDMQPAIIKMIRIRTVEEIIRQAFFDQKIFSFLHLMIGQEASPVGVAAALEATDLVMGNHRSHGHVLAMGGDLRKMVFEIFGDKRGSCKGFGGSMHMLDRSVNFEGSTPILGSVSCLATGKAFAQKFKGQSGITVCFLGDGAAEEGVFLESVNLSASKGLPIVFVIEDNKYAVNTGHSERKSARYSFKKLFEGLGAKYIRKSGQEVQEVYDGMTEARSSASRGIPAILHLDVIRFHGHSGPLLEKTDQEYREQDDSLAQRYAQDPIKLGIEFAIKELGFDNSMLQDLAEKTEQSAIAEMRQILEEIDVRY